MLPGTVHAALVVIFSWLVRLAFNAVGIDLTEDAYYTIAAQIVAYILSLVGLALFNRARAGRYTIATEEYKPPFT